FFRFAFGFFYWCDHPFFRTIGIFWNRLFVRRTPKDMIAYAARCVKPSVVNTGTYPNAATARPVRRVERLPPAMPPIKVSATTRATCCGGVDSIISVVKLVFQESLQEHHQCDQADGKRSRINSNRYHRQRSQTC